MTDITWNWSCLSCGCIWWVNCITMVMKTNYHDTVNKYPSPFFSLQTLPSLSLDIFYFPFASFFLYVEFVVFKPCIISQLIVHLCGQEWSFLRIIFTTLNRDYALINNIHSDIGTHVIHHLFPKISHYHLIEVVNISLHKILLVMVISKWVNNII